MKSFLAGIFGLLVMWAPVFADEAAPSRVEAGHAAVAPRGVENGSPNAPITMKKVPEYVPIVVDRAQYEAVMGHLNGMVFKDALPLVKWLSELEDRAKRQWEADNAPKPETPKP